MDPLSLEELQEVVNLKCIVMKNKLFCFSYLFPSLENYMLSVSQ